MSNTKKSYSWTKQKVHDLITLYEKNECLWNCSIESYKDRQKRLDAVNKVCEILGITKQQFARKIHNLRNQLNFEIKKVSKKNSADGTDEYTTKWEYFDRLQFLRKFITARPSFDSFKYEVQNVTADEGIMNSSYDSNTQLVIEEQNSIPQNCEPQADHLNDVVHQEIYEENTDVTTYHTSDVPLKDSGNQTVTHFQSTNLIPMPKKIRSDFESSMDEWEIFGQFVTSELRSLKSEVSKKKLKRRIMQAILEVGNEDDGININIKLT